MGNDRSLVVGLLLSLALGLALLASACTGSTGSDTSADGDPADGAVGDPAVGDTGAAAETAPPDNAAAGFCDQAEAFINDRSVTAVASFSAEFFATVDQRLTRLVDTAPDEVRSDFEALRTGFDETNDIFARFDYDVTDQQLGQALEAVDNEAMLAATENIQDHLVDNCGLDPVGSLDPEQVNQIMDAFGVERALAECLNLELGDVANIDPEELTPELLNRPVCGTTLLVLLTAGQPTT